MKGIFKAYDIRGIYGQDLNEETAFNIGRAFVTFLRCRTVVVGRDARPHSLPLADALEGGLMAQGADVVDLGLSSTPMCYYANAKLKADAGIMITASHNPPEWNGFKLCRAQAVPISGETGIEQIEAIVRQKAWAEAPASAGRRTAHDILPEYIEHVRGFARLARPVRVAVDMANAMGIYEAKALQGLVEMTPLYDTLDGRFPNHEANPLDLETLRDVQAVVRTGAFDFGVAFDGDADRVGFLDEKGDVVPMDFVTALIAQDLLAQGPAVVLYDLRSSRAVAEVIRESGGTPRKCRVGHSFIKQQMRAENALFAGEVSGHYYFRDNSFCESGAIAMLSVANIVSRAATPLSGLIAPLRRYFASGELNSKAQDPTAALARLRARYGDGRQEELDGLSVAYDDWWFNVRESQTEAKVRLNLEAVTRALMERKRDEVLAEIRK
jgi:phosphomannomutase